MSTGTCRPLSLSDGSVCWLDTDNYADIVQYRWYPTSNGYAMRWKGTGDDKEAIYMHTQITGFERTDHWNGNKLDNRRSNLREATSSQNGANRRKGDGVYSSRFKGVTWHILHEKWIARIAVQRTRIQLGYFENEIDAARAYDAAAIKYFGEFARLNTYGEGGD